MAGDRAERASVLFEQALKLSPARRARFLEEVARREPTAHAELVALLDSHAAAPDYLADLAERVLPGAVRGLAAGLPPPFSPGQTVGRYRILDELGGGGMGIVYKALDPTLDRPVALKFLPPILSADPGARSRLIAEARAASALDHPNIAVVHEMGTLPPGEDDAAPRPFIAMAYYAGHTLQQKLTGGPLPLAEAVDYGTQLASGLARAHEADIVHRDIKPANVMITERGQVKIVDFGIAKLADREVTREHVTPGTIAYMSPEQTRGEPVDPRTDVWSAGAVLFEMIAGRRPFRGGDDAVLIHAIRHDPAPPLRDIRPEVPEALARLIDRCLRKEPDDRYADAGALRDELERLDPGYRSPTSRPGRRARLVVGIALGAAAVVAGLLLPARSPPDAAVGSASSILVLPFVPPADDTVLKRVGRDLAITLSATLDGIGDIRTVDAATVFAQLADADSEGSIVANRRRELARRLEASSVLVGHLVRDESGIRADARLLRPDGTDVLARASTIAAADALGALTDSLAVRLVHQLWQSGDAPVPSLGAVTTRSPTALRAYVDGEQALGRGDMPGAVEAFEQAFAADSTFWFAYWRTLYPRIYEGSRPDLAVLAEVFRHRDELPERDRLLIEARQAPTVTARAGALSALTDRYITYWPAAYDLANHHVHATPFVGSPIADARVALERVVALNPRFAMAWHHLFWITAFQGDIERSRTVLEALERLVDPAEPFWEASLIQFRTVLEALEGGGKVAPEREVEMAGLIRRVAAQVPELAAGFGGGLIPMGFAALQIRINRRVLATNPLRAHVADLHMATAMAWAARGAWDSVAVERDAWVRLSDDPQDALRAYGLGVFSALIGGWEPDQAASFRRAAAAAAAAGDPHDRAELGWLDGIFAYARSDTSALAEARDRVRRSGASRAARLEASLEGFQQAASGDESTGARLLESVELDAGERWAAWDHAGRHPYLFAVNRLHAARWLLAAGDTTAAARILEWYHGVPGTRDAFRDVFATFAVLPFVLTELARIAEARGRLEEAAAHRRRIVRSFDLPSSSEGRAILAEARTALARIAHR